MLLQSLVNIVNVLMPLFIAASVVFVPIGIIVAIVLGVKSSHDKKSGVNQKKYTGMIITFAVGPIASIFVFVSIWGLLNIVSKTLN